MRKYTLVYHPHFYNSSFIEMKQVRWDKRRLEQEVRKGIVHFIILGWPKIMLPDGSPLFLPERRK